VNDRTIVNFTPTGMLPTKRTTPHVPVTVDEIVESVHEAAEIGISMVHLHARDPVTGEPTLDPEIYAGIIAGVRSVAPELVVCVSLSGRGGADLRARLGPVALTGSVKPDMASLTLSSLNFNQQASVNDPATIQALAMAMKQAGVMPELEAFDAGMINYARYLARKGLLDAPYYFNLILGNIACAQADLLHAGIMIRDLPEGSSWSLGGIGSTQLAMNAVAIAMGGGVRVGLEDALHLDRGRSTLATNAALLRRTHELARIHDRPVMTPAELRRVLRLGDARTGFGRKPIG
jgi:3-keto-5-aminohexanoate cleavage enzyme